MVYVLDITGSPLMPTERHGKVRRMLRDGKAKVVKKNPFTIQLKYETTNYTQPITLGVDSGSKHIGLSASTKKKELYVADVQLRTDIVDKISSRREARKTRRNRKTRYRKVRFQNRIKSKHKGWLAPSVGQKIQCHLKQVEDVHKILPVRKIVIETASFDLQKIQNPDIHGVEYQHGPQFGFWNVREYILFRDNHTCQHCQGKKKDPILNVHHIESRKTGGDSPNNLITLCETCHKKYHSLSSEKQKMWKLKRGRSLKDTSFMGVMRRTFYERLKEMYPKIEVQQTFGYITKNNRIRLGLKKEHYNDAYCIAGNFDARPLTSVLFKKKVRRHNRQIHKFNTVKGGKRKLNQTPYLVKGFRLFDKVEYQGQECFISGRRASGSFALKTFDWEKVSDGVTFKKLKLLEKRSGYITARKERAFLQRLKPLVSSPEK
ncbi:RNA-guided endonuclease IscB [Faecalibaculum rodentium]|uniref:RNA-guided endonuclease IscB n=1 Tax=Faecalibaculum rodentium TaxID=1702221 RepID=UPI002731F172|nr:RNA-guided endonuclease IscB [Faecalibaculum rodentium]